MKSELTRIDPQKRQAIFKDNEGEKSYPYDFLHVTPIMGPPDCLGNSLLTNTHGFLHIDKHTLQSINFKNVFGLGDVCGILHSKIGADVACQSRIVVANLVCLIEGKKLKGAYDGYTSCPLITGEKKVILAEFDYEMVPKEVSLYMYQTINTRFHITMCKVVSV